MSAEGTAPECAMDMHELCAGPKVIRRQGAPTWEAPILTLRCGCRCHRIRSKTPAGGAAPRVRREDGREFLGGEERPSR